MKIQDGRLKALIREVYDKEPVPGFDEIWSQAEKRMEERRAKGDAWRWALGPVVLAGSAVAVALILAYIGQPPRTTSKEIVAVREAKAERLDLNGLEDLKPWSAPLDRIFSGHNLLPLDGLLVEIDDSVDTDANESDGHWDDTYRFHTDALLDIETTATSVAEKRSLL